MSSSAAAAAAGAGGVEWGAFVRGAAAEALQAADELHAALSEG
jgi:hypothetical protein